MKFIHQVLLLLTATLFFHTSIQAQDLILTHGNNTKEIKANTFIHILIPPEAQNPDSDCDGRYITGQFISQSRDSIQLRLVSIEEVVTPADHGQTLTSTTYRDWPKAPIQAYAKSAILRIDKAGRKKARENTTGEIIGYSLILLGTAHLISSPFIEAGELTHIETAGLGLGEILLGLVIAGFSDQKTFITSSFCPGMRHDVPVWSIE
jgi:hypothetical protein